jgi:L-asparagine oxygenase
MRQVSTRAVHELSAADAEAVGLLAAGLSRRFRSSEDPRFLAAARQLAYRHLPDSLIGALTSFRDHESSSVLLISGFPVDDVAIGPTPDGWKSQPDQASTLPEELYLLLLASALGDPFGWATLQEGHIVQNVLPVRDQEFEQSGHGSVVTLAWHTEDGFHPYRCDYLSLLALRNDEMVPTTIGGMDDVVLPAGCRAVLAQPRFLIRPDNEHINQRTRDGEGLSEALPDDWYQPEPTAVLFGSPAHPYLRIDPYFMSALPRDDEAAEALAILEEELERVLTEAPLAAGTVAFIDNFRAVHGRQAFQPRYDGRDRWLKKVVITRDLRKSRAARGQAGSRVLQPTALYQGAGVLAGSVR